jgi:hypothetical protein
VTTTDNNNPGADDDIADILNEEATNDGSPQRN